MLLDCLFSISPNQLQKCHSSQLTQVKKRYQNYLLNFAKLVVKNELKNKESKQIVPKTKTLGQVGLSDRKGLLNIIPNQKKVLENNSNMFTNANIYFSICLFFQKIAKIKKQFGNIVVPIQAGQHDSRVIGQHLYVH